MRRTLLLLSAFTAPALAHAQSAVDVARTGAEIVASGTGTVTLKPDRATVTIAVVTRAVTAADAGRLNVERIRRVIAALKRQGLADSLIVTTGYAVSQEHDPYGRTPASSTVRPVYAARNAIRLTFADLDRLGQLLDTALVSGATEIARVQFASSLERQARQRAIADAVRASRNDAEAAAAAAGGSLGALVELLLDPEGDYAMARIRDFAGSGYTAAATPLMPADVSVEVRVRMRFQFVARP